MSSIVHAHRYQLKTLGEYVVLTNIEPGWFAVFENTLNIQIDKSTKNGRNGPNLIIYRTRNEGAEDRDHYVVPYSVFITMVTDNTVAVAKIKTSRRWNFTLKNDQLHVTHGSFINIGEYYRAKLITEAHASNFTPNASTVHFQLQTMEAIEGLAKESVRATRSRNGQLREAAIRQSRGVCEACLRDFSVLLGGLGARALQVHHKNQLAQSDNEVITSLDDLAVLCANCHCIVHADRDQPMRVEHLKMLLQSRGDDDPL